MLRLENDLGETLFLNTDSVTDSEVPYITIRKGLEIGKTYHITPNDISSIRNYFGNYIDLPSLALWLEKEGKEIVDKEDLHNMLECVRFCMSDMMNRLQVINKSYGRLQEVCEKYKEKKDENRT